MSPYVYIENGQCTRPPTGTIAASTNPRWRAGAISDDFAHADVMPKITEKAVDFINNHCQQQPENPYFLYFPLTAPHTPYCSIAWSDGRSQAGTYGDFVTLCDWTVGQVTKAVEESGQKDNTLIIFSSDNGCHESMAKTANYGHESNYIYRGQKADIWDGGHRVPFFVQWPSMVQAGSHCSEPICHTDLMATFADITGYKLPNDAAEDSFSFLSYLLGTTPTVQTRDAIVHHSIEGGFAIRKGKWKFIDGVGSIGWSGDGDGLPGQLYDMETDPEETTNFYESESHQSIIQEMQTLLQAYKDQGYSRPME
jgi:arylsulfatase A-like enzyme